MRLMSPPNPAPRRHSASSSLLHAAISNSTASSHIIQSVPTTNRISSIFTIRLNDNSTSFSSLSSISNSHNNNPNVTPPSRPRHHHPHRSSSSPHHSLSREQTHQHGHSHSPQIHPQFRSKAVCRLTCKHCAMNVCLRGMKAILLADTRVELYSTDTPPNGVQLVNDDYITRNCRCRIRDVACLGCGNVIGYHVTSPCDTCLEACNNGHFWMFHSEGVAAIERKDAGGTNTLLWANLPASEKDAEAVRRNILCR